ncbi:MAG: hypothetical protein KDC26_08375 [Armatimonadetes bacterium]|nr:hypothetical protein [Armatimonadota bacterium]
MRFEEQFSPDERELLKEELTDSLVREILDREGVRTPNHLIRFRKRLRNEEIAHLDAVLVMSILVVVGLVSFLLLYAILKG